MACSPQALAEFSEKASNNIGETGVNLADMVQKLKVLLAENYGDLRLPPDSDYILERSLRYRKFDISRAASHLQAFFKLLQDRCKIYKNMYFLPSLHRQVFFDTMAACLLKNRDSKGRSVILFNIERMPIDLYDLDHGLTVLLLLMDEITRISVETQRIGLVIVSNMKGYGFAHAKQYTLSRIRTTVRLVQGAFPARFKGFHMVNTPRIFLYIYTLMKPFLSEKIKKRVSFHGDNFTEFHKQVSPDILPDFLGGKLTCEEAVDLEFTKRLLAKDEYYRELLKYGYMENEEVES